MSGIEAYRIQSNFLLDLTQSLAAIKEYAGAWRDVLAIHQQVKNSIDGITAQTTRAAMAARNYANALRDANGYTAGMAANVAGAAAAMQQASDSAKQAVEQAAQSRALVVAGPRVDRDPTIPPFVIGAPGSGIPGYGTPYGPARLGFSGATGGGGGGGGFTIPGAAAYGPDEPFNDPNNPPAINLNSRSGTRGDWYSIAWGAQVAGNKAGSLVDSSFGQAASAEQLRRALGIGAEGMNKGQVDKAWDAAFATKDSVTGSDVMSNLLLIKSFMAITQDAGAATAALPALARYRVEMQGLGRNGDADVMALIQSAELRGAVLKPDGKGGEEFDAKAFNQFMRNSEMVSGMTGGRYGMTDVGQFLRSAGASGKTLSDDSGFVEYLALIQAMQSTKAGTALKAFGQQFVAGRMSLGTVDILEGLGLVRPNPTDQPNLYHEHRGLIEYMHPGAMKDGDFEMAAQRPEQFVLTRILPAVQSKLAELYGEKYTKGTDAQKLMYEQTQMQQAASRMPAGDLMAQMLSVAQLIDRDLHAAQQYRAQNPTGNELYQGVVAGSPMMVAQQMRANIQALQIEFGSANMTVTIAMMKALTLALQGLDAVFAADPALPMIIGALAGALKVLAPAIGLFAIGAPAYLAFKNLSAQLPQLGTAADGAAVGLKGLIGRLLVIGAIKGAIDAADPQDKWDAWGDKNIPGYKWVDYKLNKLFYGTGDDKADRKAFDNARGLTVNLTVPVSVDGDHVQTIKKTIRDANGPNTGTPGNDTRAMPPAPGEH